MPRLKLVVPILVLVACALPVLAADDATQPLSLSPRGEVAPPVVKVLAQRPGAMSLELDVTSLDVADVTIDGRAYQAMTLTDGGTLGEPGEPMLPTVTRLVAVPAGVGVRLTVTGKDMAPLPSTSLAPVQPVLDGSRGEAAPVATASVYAAAPRREATASVGEPALVRGIRVVPVTFSPVSYDPRTGELAVARTLTVDLTFAGRDTRNDPTGAPHAIPESFARMYEQEIIGYERSGDVAEGPGSYLMICPSDPAVVAAVQPLVEWRRRQGYNVVLATTAETGTTTTTIKDYIQNAYDTYDPPLEFVSLVGDGAGSLSLPTFHESLSGYNGEGDHPYTLLDGNDPLADIHIGRISVTSVSELQLVIAKIVQYESDPDMSETNWFTTAGVTGDPSASGYSTVWCQQFVKESLQHLGYTRVDTIFGGDYATQMFNTINNGETLFTYRGYIGMSGFNTGYITALGNQRQLPFAIVMTCGTGSFASETTCRSEAFLRATNGGGVAAIGTATTGTHTRYNNCIFLGTAHGVLNTGEYRVGPALTRGKLNLYKNYEVNEPDRVVIWSYWNNLMGDPATEIFTGVPQIPTVTYSANVASGANALPVTVAVGAAPLAGARVTVVQAGNLRATGTTDAAGQIVLPLAGAVDGVLQVTVTKHNLKPYLGSCTMGAVSASLDYSALQVSESSGNGDDVANPGESLLLNVQLTNHGGNSLSGVVATLSCPLSYVHITAATRSFGTLAGGASAWSQGTYALGLDVDAPGGRTIPLRLDATSGAQTWTSLVDLDVTGPRATIASLTYGGPGGTLDPGESGTIVLTLTNDGNLATSGATATLLCDSDWITVGDPNGAFGAIPPGGMGAQTNSFTVSVTTDCYPGHLANFQVALQFAEGGVDTLEFQEVVGTSQPGDPSGPDMHGYYAFDNEDTDVNAPTFAWSDITALGQNTGIVDNSLYDDDTKTLDLPFTFVFYGKPQNKVSICSNGWLAFGTTYQRLYRNWHLPSDGGPGNMICAFWDDLANGTIYTYNDTAQHRFVVQWTGWRTKSGSGFTGNNTFQIILYDPAFYPTSTGDGPVVLQYNAVTVVGDETTYFTTGIQNEDRTDGLTYAYGNHYAGGAAELEPGRAIAFRPVVPLPHGDLAGLVTNASGGTGTPVPDAIITVLGTNANLSTGDDGRYVGSIPVGTWDLACQHDGFAPDTTRSVMIAADQVTEVDFALTDIGGPSFLNTTNLSNTTDTTGPYVVESAITDFTGVADRHMYYTSSVTGGPFEVSLTIVDPQTGLVRGEIPGQPVGTRIQYWLTAADVLGYESSDPAGAPWPVYSFQIVLTSQVITDNMETGLGWQTNAEGLDTASSGLWTRVDPNQVLTMPGGLTVVPGNDHTPGSGIYCWVTGQDADGAVQGGNDVDGGATTLYSPVYDLSGYDSARLSYWRWYTNDTGGNVDDWWYVQVRSGSSPWVPLEHMQTSQRAWVQQTFALENYIPLTSGVQLRFVAEDHGAESIVEALIDDLSIDANELVTDLAVPTVILTAPNGGQTFHANEPVAVTWNATDDIGVVQAQLTFVETGGLVRDVATGPFNGSYTFVWSEHFGSLTQPTSGRFRVTVFDGAQHQATDTADGDVAFDVSTGIDDLLPSVVSLAQNQPNPFNPRTTIHFSVPRTQEISVQIFDLQGKLVRTLVHGLQAPGDHAVTWQGQDDRGVQAASGMYFYRLTSEEGQQTRKMLLLK